MQPEGNLPYWLFLCPSANGLRTAGVLQTIGCDLLGGAGTLGPPLRMTLAHRSPKTTVRGKFKATLENQLPYDESAT